MKILLAATAITGAISATPALAGTTITGSLQFGDNPNNRYDPTDSAVTLSYGNHAGRQRY